MNTRPGIAAARYQLWRERLRSLPQLLRPRPNSGYFWLDIVFIFLLVALQGSILSGTLGGSTVAFDLLTPWIVVSTVQQSYGRASVLACLAGWAWETRTGLPAGTAISSYWIMVNILHFVRELLSWRHLVPWLTTFALCSLTAGIYEWFILGILRSTLYVSWSALLYLVLRVISATLFGLLLTYRSFSADIHEVTRQ